MLSAILYSVHCITLVVHFRSLIKFPILVFSLFSFSLKAVKCLYLTYLYELFHITVNFFRDWISRFNNVIWEWKRKMVMVSFRNFVISKTHKWRENYLDRCFIRKCNKSTTLNRIEYLCCNWQEKGLRTRWVVFFLVIVYSGSMTRQIAEYTRFFHHNQKCQQLGKICRCVILVSTVEIALTWNIETVFF